MNFNESDDSITAVKKGIFDFLTDKNNTNIPSDLQQKANKMKKDIKKAAWIGAGTSAVSGLAGSGLASLGLGNSAKGAIAATKAIPNATKNIAGLSTTPTATTGIPTNIPNQINTTNTNPNINAIQSAYTNGYVGKKGNAAVDALIRDNPSLRQNGGQNFINKIDGQKAYTNQLLNTNKSVPTTPTGRTNAYAALTPEQKAAVDKLTIQQSSGANAIPTTGRTNAYAALTPEQKAAVDKLTVQQSSGAINQYNQNLANQYAKSAAGNFTTGRFNQNDFYDSVGKYKLQKKPTIDDVKLQFSNLGSPQEITNEYNRQMAVYNKNLTKDLSQNFANLGVNPADYQNKSPDEQLALYKNIVGKLSPDVRFNRASAELNNAANNIGNNMVNNINKDYQIAQKNQ